MCVCVCVCVCVGKNMLHKNKQRNSCHKIQKHPPHHTCQRVDLQCQFYRSNVPKKNVVNTGITGCCFYIDFIETQLNFNIYKAHVTNHKICTCCYRENY